MLKCFCTILFLSSLSLHASAQDLIFQRSSDRFQERVDSPGIKTYGLADKKRVWLVAGTTVSLWAISFAALNSAWYADYPRSSFHLFNDLPEWNQMDKAGHTWTTYHVSRVSTEMWNWTGIPKNKAVIFGSLSAIAYESIVEIQDGFSKEWGFSLSDMAANVTGAAAFAAQEFGWKKQRLQVKLGYWPHSYPNELITRRNQLFGKGRYERILKDYNSQTYWVSANLSSFFPEARLPGWLNISLGYGSDGMFGGTKNIWTDKEGNPVSRTDILRVRHFYIAPDVDLTKIKTKHKLLSTVFYVLNMVKFPAPALELNSRGRALIRGIKF